MDSPQVDVLSDLTKVKADRISSRYHHWICPEFQRHKLHWSAGLFSQSIVIFRGKGHRSHFPDLKNACESKHSNAPAYILSQFGIHAMLHGDQTVPKLCNVADEETTTCNKKCRGLVEYFGLKPGRPHLSSPLPQEFFKKYASDWDKVGEEWSG